MVRQLRELKHSSTQILNFIPYYSPFYGILSKIIFHFKSAGGNILKVVWYLLGKNVRVSKFSVLTGRYYRQVGHNAD